MTQEQSNWWRIALELKLRQSNGDAFQDFFSTLMGHLHGNSYVRVRPFGKLGDKGCDGYLLPSGQVFQCYGALNGSGGKVSNLIKKIGVDFSKAKKAIPKIMKEWHMVHNLVDGLPIEAIEKLEQLKIKNPSIKFGFIGFEGFESRVFQLDHSVIERLLGVVATSHDSQNIHAEEIRNLVQSIAAVADATPFDVTTIRPVPPDKLDLNKLPSHWRALIAGGWQNSNLISEYFDRHHDPLLGVRIAKAFRDRYLYLKAQGLNPGNIMSSLYEMVVPNQGALPAKQVAAQALLAYLFESCEIFEGISQKGAA